MAKLNRAQYSRLGALIAVYEGRVPYDNLLEDLVARELVVSEDDSCEGESVLRLNERGLREHDRLMTIGGFMVVKTT